jgi:hypothetical protein
MLFNSFHNTIPIDIDCNNLLELTTKLVSYLSGQLEEIQIYMNNTG